MTSIQLNQVHLEVHQFNDHFVLLRQEQTKGLAVIGEAILHHGFAFIDEVIATEQEIYIQLNSRYRAGDLHQLEQLNFEATKQGRSIKLPVHFDGQGDWASVCQLSGLRKEAYIEKMLVPRYTVAMIGFLPGFVYMDGLEKALQVPRKSIPSRHIPANSLAVGAQYLGIYSLPSPGGWQVLGQIPFSILNWQELPPVALHSSDWIQLIRVDQATFDNISKNQPSIAEYNGFA